MTQPAPIVEPIEPRDLSAVRHIAAVSRQTLDLDAELTRPWANLWVARQAPAGPALGFLLAWRVADELHVVNVATHPDFRRRGLALALLSRALTEAGRDRTRLVLLEVRRTNQAAIALYRSLGFSVSSIRRGYYSDTSEDAIEMMLAIDPETGHPLPGEDEIEIEEASS